MRFQGIIPVLLCHNPDELLVFYQQVMRYIVIGQRQGPGGLEWAHLKSGDSLLMLQKSSQKNRQELTAKDNILLYYYTDDVEAEHRFISAKQYPVTPITTTGYKMKEFFIDDPEGNRLAIGQKITDEL
ncbi:MAG: hypothetical protein OEY43_05275 [Gammaproteobacteria bacterium]|nr:hypothetical protein [Gammaproteobacteria bacterium]